jgi:hypothetical protein
MTLLILPAADLENSLKSLCSLYMGPAVSIQIPPFSGPTWTGYSFLYSSTPTPCGDEREAEVSSWVVVYGAPPGRRLSPAYTLIILFTILDADFIIEK